ncbi:DUF4236 domain-containing protein [Myxococcota bacterium]|nr:DUF4236 domain-containing protein [Myxococcota bacterium]MCZ7617972.1 DUF4236 domain-containing protein [Myxococcota bacterium]
MSFFIRDSVRVGPFRFNLSKSGVGVSVGVRGARVGMSPRGNYVHMGRHGLYYRTALPAFGGGGGAGGRRLPRSAPAGGETRHPVPEQDGLHEIESGDTSAMRDSSSEELLREISEKRALSRRAGPVLAVGSLLSLGAAAAAWQAQPTIPSWAPVLVFGTLVVATAVASVFAHRCDELGKSVVLFYEFEGDAEREYQALHDAFADLRDCAAIWHVEAASATGDWKRSGGATTAVRRKQVSLGTTPPAIIKTNIAVPSIPCGRETLYLFPDRVLVFTSAHVGAVSYADLQLEQSATRFVEEGAVPRDAEVVDTTWQYVNRSGGPDRRFKNNRQLPVVRYEELHFRSASGLNELLQLSRSGAGTRLAETVDRLARSASASGGSGQGGMIRTGEYEERTDR